MSGITDSFCEDVCCLLRKWNGVLTFFCFYGCRRSHVPNRPGSIRHHGALCVVRVCCWCVLCVSVGLGHCYWVCYVMVKCSCCIWGSSPTINLSYFQHETLPHPLRYAADTRCWSRHKEVHECICAGCCRAGAVLCGFDVAWSIWYEYMGEYRMGSGGSGSGSGSASRSGSGSGLGSRKTWCRHIRVVCMAPQSKTCRRVSGERLLRPGVHVCVC